ncbi:MAG: DUF1566 domain-containing protein [Comamonadaceae bacterium]|nr:DUF1566 domain-containing protein [Comamonadaceae bacterium]
MATNTRATFIIQSQSPGAFSRRAAFFILEPPLMHTLPALSVFSRLSVLRSALTLTAALLLGTIAVQAAPTGLLNDTGQTWCTDANDAWVACDSGTTGDAGTRPRQDGRFGRDVANPSKVGGGAAGFDFTPLDASGNAIALTGSPAVPSATPRCVKDNVTNLIWEVKTTSGLQDSLYRYAWGSNLGDALCGLSTCSTDAFIAALNAADLCGETANDWRLPTRRELLSLTHRGIVAQPKIDANFFPETRSYLYWTNDIYPPNPSNAWIVNFLFGASYFDNKTSSNYVRLVRSGQ